MFFQGDHQSLKESIEAIGASFAVYEPNESDSFLLISCNSLYEEIIGMAVEKAIAKELHQLFPRYISSDLSELFHQSCTQKGAVESEFFVDYKGEQRWWRSVTSPIFNTSLGTVRIIQTCVEITEKKALEHQLNLTMSRYQAVVNSAYDGIITIDESHIIQLVNPAAEHIFGYTKGECEQLPLSELLPPQYREKHPSYVEGFRLSPVDSRPMQTRAAVTGYKKGGTEIPIEVTISKIKVDDQTEMTAVIRDISEKSRLIEELLTASNEDSLTGLFNRRRFGELLSQEASRSERYGTEYCLLMLDLDHFKKVNDSYGHACGDQMLVEIAKLLIQHCRQTDVVSRWGGEEFLILAPENSLTEGVQLAERLRQAIEEFQLTYQSNSITITGSFGIAYFHQAEATVEEQLNQVDNCLYSAKAQGRNRVVSTES